MIKKDILNLLNISNAIMLFKSGEFTSHFECNHYCDACISPCVFIVSHKKQIAFDICSQKNVIMYISKTDKLFNNAISYLENPTITKYNEWKKIMLNISNRQHEQNKRNEQQIKEIEKYSTSQKRVGFIYLFKIGECYKIGRSHDVKQRFKEMSQLHPNTTLIAKKEVVDYVLAEKELLTQYKQYLVAGKEWFRFPEQIFKKVLTSFIV